LREWLTPEPFHISLTISSSNIGWKYYLCFIIPGYIFAVIVFFFYPDTKALPLEEIAALFGDSDEIFLGNLEVAEPRYDESIDEGKEKTVLAEHQVAEWESFQQSWYGNGWIAFLLSVFVEMRLSLQELPHGNLSASVYVISIKSQTLHW
jgi:hypothetical protein